MNYPLLAKFLGFILLAAGALVIPSMLWAVWFREWTALLALAEGGAASAAAGGLLWVLGRRATETLYQREALALVGLSWILAGVSGALPYIFAGELSPPEAFFESVSGFTTTGASVLPDIEALPKSLLFWRSFTHWVGGMGIVVLFIAVLPYLGAGGKQLFRSESPGPDPHGLRPRIQESAWLLYKIYTGLTVIQTLILMACGLPFFDALCHTFGTLATGGFSPYAGSIGHYNSFLIEAVVIVFMIIAGTNFSLYFEFFRRDADRWRVFYRDTEWRVYIGILLGATLVVSLNLMGYIGTIAPVDADPGAGAQSPSYGPLESVRAAAFQVVSIMTTTGYMTEDFNEWPPLSRLILVLMMFIGGCAGSTGGGLKVVRIVLMMKIAYLRLERTFRPKTIRALRMGNNVVDNEVQQTLLGFMVIYGVWLVVGVLMMSGFGLPFETAITAVVATINNIGPGLGLVGATSDFRVVPDPGKVYLALCMVLGRLEIFSICVLLMPAFWRVNR